MTETCGIISLENPPKAEARQFGSTGMLVSGVEGKVVSVDTLKSLPPNQLGELCFRGPNIMQGKTLFNSFGRCFILCLQLCMLPNQSTLMKVTSSTPS